jgi:hypothetical protein
MVQMYCVDVGIPSPPPGREWWIERPGDISDGEFFRALNHSMRKLRSPADDLKAVKAFLDEAYRSR